MPALKDTAQVLRTFEHGNSSLIVVMLGRTLGQFRMLAKGVQRHSGRGFEGGLDLLTRGEVLVYPRPGDSLWIFHSWDEHPRPLPLGSEESLAATSYLCEFTEALTRQMAGAIRNPEPESESESESEPDPSSDDSSARLYDLLAKAGDALAHGLNAGAILLAYTLKALEIEGMLPSLNLCHRCGKTLSDGASPGPESVWLSFDGMTCSACHGKALTLPSSASTGTERRSLEQGVWLPPEAHYALHHLHASSRVVRLSAQSAELLSRGLPLLVHGALEHDLRTLPEAVKAVRQMAKP